MTLALIGIISQVIANICVLVLSVRASLNAGRLAEEVNFLEARLEYLEKLNQVFPFDTEDE
jgi:hypothetical protein